MVLRDMFSVGLGSVKFIVGLSDHKGLPQSKQFYDTLSDKSFHLGNSSVIFLFSDFFLSKL